jgi:hypothetical protein
MPQIRILPNDFPRFGNFFVNADMKGNRVEWDILVGQVSLTNEGIWSEADALR